MFSLLWFHPVNEVLYLFVCSQGNCICIRLWVADQQPHQICDADSAFWIRKGLDLWQGNRRMGKGLPEG